MKKSDIASRVASLTSLSKAAGTVAVNAVFTAIADTQPKGETITVTGFGTFTTRMRPALQGPYRRTGEQIVVQTPTALLFKSGKILCETP